MSRTLLAASAGGPAPFTPADLAHVPELWCPPAGLSGIPRDLWTNAGTAGGSFVAAGADRPSAGTINGKNCIDLDGTNNRMTSALLLSDVITASAYHLFCVIEIDVFHTNDLVTYYQNEGAIASNAAYLVMGLTSSGTFMAGHFSSGNETAPSITLTTSAILLEQWYDGTNLRSRVANGLTVPDPAANVGSLSGGLLLGCKYDGTVRVNGRIAEPIMAKVVYSGADQTNLRDYYAAQYGVVV